MTWIKNNAALVFSILVCLASLILGYFVVGSFNSKFTIAEGDLEVERQNFTNLTTPKSKSFPSSKNVDQSKVNQKLIQKSIDQLLANYNNPDLPKEKTDPIVFKNRFTAFKDLMDKRVADKNIKVPEKFAYGFTYYFSALPDPEDTDVLNQQLSAVEFLLTQLTETEVPTEIKLIKRSVFEKKVSADRGQSQDNAGPIVENPLYRELPFELSFTGDVRVLNNFINVLARSRNVFSVKSMRINNELQKLPSLIEIKKNQKSDEQSGLTPFLGNEKVSVDLVISLIEFKETPKVVAVPNVPVEEVPGI